MDATDHFLKLNQQYNKTAEDLIAQKKYQKAAFIYMKLLKNYHKAADTLRTGRFYQEAAAIYLKYAKDKNAAAECYKDGLFYKEAIELYKELKQYEKAGDLLVEINKIDKAYEQFTLLANQHINKKKYVMASLVYRNKMHDRESAQSLLLKGWETNNDSYNCLNNYFHNIDDQQACLQAIYDVHKKSVNKNNNRTFLKALSLEYKKKNEISGEIKEERKNIIDARLFLFVSLPFSGRRQLTNQATW